jgi:integrase
MTTTQKYALRFAGLGFVVGEALYGYDGVNPIKDSETPTGKAAKATHAYTEDEINAIAGVFDGTALTAILLAAHTGLRKGELEGLIWADFDGRTLHVRRSLWNGFSSLPKTDASLAPVPVNRQLREALKVHRKEQGDTWARDGFPILQSEVHSPLNLANLVKRVIVPRLEQCTVCGDQKADHSPETDHQYERDKTLPRWHGWHAFRRGLASNLHADGVADMEIQGVLRHSNVRITQECYIKTMPKARVDAVEARGEKMQQEAALCTNRAPIVHQPEPSRPN